MPDPESSLSLSGVRPSLTAEVVLPDGDGQDVGTAAEAGAAEGTPSPEAVAAQAGGSGEAAAPVATAAPEYRTHVVAWGDTLLEIALAYGVPLNDIIALNGLPSNVIYIGQTLRIPAPQVPVGGQQYVVRPGDSLYGIANAHGVTLGDLLRANHLTNGHFLRVGQILVIPTGPQLGQPATTTTTAGTGVQAAATGKRVHIVQPGDSVFSIAQYYGVVAQEIAQLNNLVDANVLQVGQQLVIP
jgi:LysM repeat protein